MVKKFISLLTVAVYLFHSLPLHAVSDDENSSDSDESTRFATQKPDEKPNTDTKSEEIKTKSGKESESDSEPDTKSDNDDFKTKMAKVNVLPIEEKIKQLLESWMENSKFPPDSTVTLFMENKEMCVRVKQPNGRVFIEEFGSKNPNDEQLLFDLSSTQIIIEGTSVFPKEIVFNEGKTANLGLVFTSLEESEKKHPYFIVELNGPEELILTPMPDVTDLIIKSNTMEKITGKLSMLPNLANLTITGYDNKTPPIADIKFTEKMQNLKAVDFVNTNIWDIQGWEFLPEDAVVKRGELFGFFYSPEYRKTKSNGCRIITLSSIIFMIEFANIAALLVVNNQGDSEENNIIKWTATGLCQILAIASIMLIYPPIPLFQCIKKLLKGRNDYNPVDDNNV